MRIKRIQAIIIAGLLLLMLVLPQLTLADPADSISLFPTSGRCGDLIKVTATVEGSFTEPVTYRICWDCGTTCTPEDRVATFTAYAAGNYTIEFHVPETAKDTYIIYLTREDYYKLAEAEFEVFPYAGIDSTEGPVGTEVTVSGCGFKASQNIRVSFQDTEETDTADADGKWEVTLTIPPTPGDDYTFTVEFKEGVDWYDLAGKYFKVTPEITAPSSGTVGQTVKVEGTGFASEEEDIEVTFDGEVVQTNILPADEDGSWSADIVIPPLQSGTYPIDASGMLTRARDVPDVDFILDAGILVEPGLAYVGDTIAVAGGGFAPLETGIKVTFDGTVKATGITARDDGTWESSFVLPASSYGSHTVSASGDITKPAVETTLDTKAKIEELSPVEGAPGDSVSLTGSGFSNNRKLTVTVGGVAVTENLQTQPNGNVVINFHVPKGSPEGKQPLVVTDEGGATHEDEVYFTVKKKTLSITPLPISPKGSTLRSGEVTFKWQGVSGDTGYTYTLEINTSADSGKIWSKSGIEGSSYTLTKTETVDEALDKGTYYWRVKIEDDYGNESAWSDSSKFTVSPIPTWVWVVVGVVVLVGLMVVAYRETKFKVTE